MLNNQKHIDKANKLVYNINYFERKKIKNEKNIEKAPSEPTRRQETIDDYTKIEKSWFCEVSVTDVENGMLLDGAKFELRDENNNLIESWISSSKEAHRIENIKDGLYTLTEVAAPEG